MRQWLPELARMPTEWIHHPWDAPLNVVRCAGVDLGVNYPKPIIDIDLARERLREAIFKMWEMEAVAKASDSNGANEEVVDNAGVNENLPISNALLKPEETASCPTISSNDQKVPTLQNGNTNPLNRKRSKCVVEEGPEMYNGHSQNYKVKASRKNEDLCSTAESSAAKQATSICSFSVPQQYSSSEVKSFQDCESSDLKQPWQAQSEMEHTSGKDGKQLYIK